MKLIKVIRIHVKFQNTKDGKQPNKIYPEAHDGQMIHSFKLNDMLITNKRFSEFKDRIFDKYGCYADFIYLTDKAND